MQKFLQFLGAVMQGIDGFLFVVAYLEVCAANPTDAGGKSLILALQVFR